MELFGYEKGAFTGANTNGKYGKFELANKGTIFLDEIGDMPIYMQPKLLRVMEEKEIERIGGKSPIKVDFRLISASNQNLEELVEKGLFRKDLFYRLNVIRLHIPPLRERQEDILPIAEDFIKNSTELNRFKNVVFSDETKSILQNYEWPGNVRELINVLSRIICFLDRDEITPYDLPLYIRNTVKGVLNSHEINLENITQRIEKEEIIKALKVSNNNKTVAAKILGIHRTHLYKKLKKYNIDLVLLMLAVLKILIK